MTSSICAACEHANRPAARFCAACGLELLARCGSCGGELAPGARFCDACGTPTAEAPSPASDDAARKVVSVIFGDLVGSTALQEALDAESVRRVMARFYAVMTAAVQRHEGRVEKFVGDGVVAVFGTPVVREDDALRAVRCAATMVADLAALGDELEATWGVRLQMRVGVNTGELVIGGDGELVGDAMNTAARLEQAASAGDVLIGAVTWQLVRDHLALEAVAPLTLKGKAEPVPAWRVVSTSADAGVSRGEAPLVARTGELDRLNAALDDAIASRACRLVSVIGSPGLGKTRLAHEFAATVGDRAAVLEGRCEPSGEGITFAPVAEVLRRAGSIGEADSPDVVHSKLADLLGDDPERDAITQRNAALLGVGEPASAQETFWALRRGLEILARGRPIVLVLDDVHWGQPLFLDLLEHLVEWVRDAPVLMVTLARPELRELREALTIPGRRATDVIELSALDAEESLALLRGMFGRVELPAALGARILEATEGNPLFLGEMLRMLVDDGVLRRDGDVLVTGRAAGEIDVPPTIQALLASTTSSSATRPTARCSRRPAPSCTRASPTGCRPRPAISSVSTRRSSPSISSRRTNTGASSAPSTMPVARWARGPRNA